MEKLYEPTFDLDMFCNKGKIINAVLEKELFQSQTLDTK